LLPIEGRILLAAVLNTPTCGAGIKLAPNARLDDGELDVAIVEQLSLLQVFGLLPRLARSGELPTQHAKREKAKAIRLTTESPCMFHGNGEIFGPAPVEIEVVPKAMQVMAPRGH
jgi:diacylglycerol kinase (ATP)